MSLSEVLAAARTRNASLQAARAGVEVADGQVQKAWTAWQPNVSAIGQVTFNSVEASFEGGALFGGIGGAFIGAIDTAFPNTLTPDQRAAILAQFQQAAPPSTVISPHVQWAGMLTLQQTLFNITALRAPGVARAGRRAAEAGAEAAEDEVLFATASVYASIVGLKELEQAAERAIVVAGKRIEDARAQLEAGTATRLSVTRAETDKVSAEGQLLSLQAQRRALLATLQALIAAPELIEVREESLEGAIPRGGEGYESRSVVRAREMALDAAEAAIGLSNLSWLPTLAAEGALRYTNVSGFSGDNFLATATINLVIPIYDRGVRYADTNIAEAQALQARNQLDNELQQARSFLLDAESRLQSAQAELAQAQAQLRLAQEAVEQIESLAQAGLATSLALTHPDSKRFGADRLVAQKKLEVILAQLRVGHARGGKLVSGKAAE
jgi:outer membrane protein TolC